MNRRRGFLVITGLLVCIILLLMGMGLLSSQASRYSSSLRSAESSQARQLALAGLEDARIKLELDQQFPPPPAPGQPVFSYSEQVQIPATPAPVNGTYTVTIDQTYKPAPDEVLLITSIGAVGPIEQPIAQYRLTAELDLKEGGRPTNGQGIPQNRHFRYTHIQDEEIP